MGQDDDTGIGPTETAFPGSSPLGRIGPYRLLRKIGEGGMGEVYLAEQTEPVRRQVAVKVIKPGLDSRQVVARFESERQALALMNHPSIARVFDAGTTERGRPYFAMEYVQGVEITDYCDTQRLTTRQRLELLIRVCAGVQHAHQKGIIHRDIKPSNVLVIMQDDEAVPKIIDFGVAKATAQKLTGKTIFTQLGVMIGTPEYMSPEQVELTGLDVDTRTDVYALGVLLYQLLVGALPFGSDELRSSGIDELRRRIREDEPSKPSTRIGTLGDESAGVVRRRHTDLPGLRKQLAGELDWIVMKALEKERARRYDSPSELAADIRRHLEDEPVLAGPPSTAYRARKFVRRHRLGVGVAGAGVLVLLLFALAMTVQAGRIARERDRANRESVAKGEVARFLKELFTIADPSESGGIVSARELLDIGAQRLDDTLTDQPEIQAELMDTMGEVYVNLGLYDEARPLVERALDTRRRVLGEEHPDTLRSLRRLADVYWYQGQLEQADATFLAALEAQRRVLGEEHPDTLHSMFDVAWRHMEKNEYAEAEALYLITLETQRRVLGPEHNDALRTMNGLAILYNDLKHYDDAERVFLEAIEIRERVMGPDHPDTLSLRNNLVTLRVSQERFQEAETLILETLEAQKRVLGEEHSDTITSLHNLAVIYMRQDRHSEARRLLEQVIAAGEEIFGPQHFGQGIQIHTLGQLCLAEGELEQAQGHLERALAIYELADTPDYLGECLYDLARLAALRDERENALRFLRRAADSGWVDAKIFEEPAFEGLGGSPRFVALVEELRERIDSALP